MNEGELVTTEELEYLRGRVEQLIALHASLGRDFDHMLTAETVTHALDSAVERHDVAPLQELAGGVVESYACTRAE